METQSWLGQRLELTVGPVAHGGHFVARWQGRVVFVRHALPGERVTALVTEDSGGSFCRADAVEILDADADRVGPPCPHARPGLCGGCDFQHVSLPRQRMLKAAVVAEQLQRLAGLAVNVTVEPVSADPAETGLGWRRRVRYASSPDGGLGLRVHRSHQVVPIQRCPLATAMVGDAAALAAYSQQNSDTEAAQGEDASELAVLLHHRRPARPGRSSNRHHRVDSRTTRTELAAGPSTLTYAAGGREFRVSAGGFWQTHPDAAAAFTQVVAAHCGLHPGDQAIDLYAGAGLFTAMLAEQVGESGVVVGIEADRTAVADAAGNLAGLPGAQVRHASVTPGLIAALGQELPDIAAVVLDPPRTGAGRDLMHAMIGLAPRVIIYVACDPAALARDLRTVIDSGWLLSHLSAFDAFPMTHHVECIAVLRPGPAFGVGGVAAQAPMGAVSTDGGGSVQATTATVNADTTGPEKYA